MFTAPTDQARGDVMTHPAALRRSPDPRILRAESEALDTGVADRESINGEVGLPPRLRMVAPKDE